MKKYFLVILVLSLLAALEPLSIDIYLPAFEDIAKGLNVEMSKVQISLSTFLAGFAIGQLLWGPVSDYYGRKRPILLAMGIFILCSFIASHVTTVGQLWVVRFFQAFSGCAGVVIGRAVVNDLFEGKLRTKVFALLVIISGVAPIIAPTLGNAILKVWHWQGIFYTMAIIGIITVLLSALFLPKNRSVKDLDLKNSPKPNLKNMLVGYVKIMANWQFVIYTFIGAMLYASLMTYVSNAPFIIMTKGGLSSDWFSLIFAINAIGLIIGTLIITPLDKKMGLHKLIKIAVILQIPISIALVVFSFWGSSIFPILVLLFMNLVLTGLLMPTTTSLALEPFTIESGTASALMGFIQLFFTFIFSTVVSYLQNNSIIPSMVAILLCALFSLLFILMDNHKTSRDIYYRIGAGGKRM
ncbi:multidrug effflux MFS transporter [Limibacterium fermenti]|uniref:multidrug effflux MFS transporter n=1 Tax=Limibacterium fermenti TaxID=3229863 RepID=UPI000E8AEB51|nr:Bcr/CflA family drug resistance efflux transporter [Porphyromonadaceae bacterium]